MLPEAAGRGQHFQARGHSFSLYGPILSWQITYLFFSCDKIGLQVLGLFYATLSLNRLSAVYKPFAKNLRNEHMSNSDTRKRKMYSRTNLFRSTLCYLH